jgi:hypothetical protein
VAVGKGVMAKFPEGFSQMKISALYLLQQKQDYEETPHTSAPN